MLWMQVSTTYTKNPLIVLAIEATSLAAVFLRFSYIYYYPYSKHYYEILIKS